jgi:hypothetical protein
MRLAFLTLALLGVLAAPSAHARNVAITVRTTEELRAATTRAVAGDVISIVPGDYAGGLFLQNLRGSRSAPIVLRALDPKRPPVFRGGSNGMQLSRCHYVEIHNLTFTDATGNGLNIDDGGSLTQQVHGIVLRGLRVLNGRGQGNNDGIKLSGLAEFRVEGCEVAHWGAQGQGIDMVGCRNGTIAGNTLRHRPGGGTSGVQMKGGCREIVVRGNRFVDAGSRAVQIGGSTGLAFFRPRPQGYEARNILVERNIIIGSDASVSFVNVDGAIFRRNTLVRPRRWALRILQETVEPGFVPSRNGVFADNIIYVAPGGEWQGAVNIGPNTAPQTFRFSGNWWTATGGARPPRIELPSREQGGVLGGDPGFRDPARGDFRPRGNAGRGKGAYDPPGRRSR